MSDSLLATYLNDHLAGATAGVELFRRATASAQGTARTDLARITAEVEQDRESLLRLMRHLGVGVRRYKVVSGWLAERASRLKSNNFILRRSPLSDLVELEALVIGVHGKAAGFRALQQVAAGDIRIDVAELERLLARAAVQEEALERLRLEAATRVLMPRSVELGQ